MKVLIAGATGAIGEPLLNCLDDAGHELFALARARKAAGPGEATRVREVVADALDAASVVEVVQRTRPDVIVNELTSLPKHYTPEEMKAAAARDKEVRAKGNANLLAAARATNCRHYVLQSSAFWYAAGPGLADETASFAFDASPGIAAGCRNYSPLTATSIVSTKRFHTPDSANLSLAPHDPHANRQEFTEAPGLFSRIDDSFTGVVE